MAALLALVVVASGNGQQYKNGGDKTCVETAFSLMTEGRDVLDALIAGVNTDEENIRATGAFAATGKPRLLVLTDIGGDPDDHLQPIRTDVAKQPARQMGVVGLVFAIFFVVVFLGHWLLNHLAQPWNLFMIAASYVFYGWWDPGVVWLLGLVSTLAWGAALWVERQEDEVRRRRRTGAGTGRR